MSGTRKSRLTAEQRQMQARLAAQTRWANTTDRSVATRPAREAFAAKFDDAPNPDAARAAHYTRMALASSRARKTA